MAGCCMLAMQSVVATEPVPRYNTVELQAEAQREVQNDLLNASLYVELNDADPAAPAQEVAAPSLEAGVSLVTVTANGAIEVIE